MAGKPIFLTQLASDLSLEKTSELLEPILKRLNPNEFQLLMAVPYGFIDQFAPKYPEVSFGVDHLLDINEGAFTAPIAARILTEAKAQFVILRLNQAVPKIRYALKAGVPPFVVIEADSEEAIRQQLSSLGELKPEEKQKLSLIYDPAGMASQEFRPDREKLIESFSLFRKVVDEAGPFQNVLGSIPENTVDIAPLLQASHLDGVYLQNAQRHLSQVESIVVKIDA